MKIAKEGFLTLGTLVALSIASCFIGPRFALLPTPLLALALWFYRDPERRSVAGPNCWLSPADGRVVEIEPAEDAYAGKTLKIGIFMNALDVHVNRFPTAGKTAGFRYVPGKKWLAFAPKASEENERLYTYIETAQGRTTLVQIAGILARRIACRISEGDSLARGERYGMIKLGSKVDVYLPLSVGANVRLGQKVKAGETVIGVVRE